MHDAEDGGGPVNSGTASMITTGNIRLRLANLQPTAKIFIYLDQRLIGNATAIDNCRFDFSILGVATPGEHEITVRQIPSGIPATLRARYRNP